MDATLFYIILSTIVVSVLSLAGLVLLILGKKKIKNLVFILVSMSAGTLIGGAFIHLLPEAAEKMPIALLFPFVIVGFVIFFIIEKLFAWRHCHEEECTEHTFGYMNLMGDAVHNFIDGAIIAAAFLIDVKTGIATVIAISMHEIPQEISDFAVLIHSGFKRGKALFMNFLVALTAVAGGLFGYFMKDFAPSFVPYILPIAAGGFLYIAATDLVPEIQKEMRVKQWWLNFVIFVGSVVLMYFLKQIGG